MHKKTENRAIYPICQNGFKSKTITVNTFAGGTKFPLQQINEIGLPKDSLILAIWAREHDSTITANNGLKMVSSDIFSNSYLALKDRANRDNRINLLISDYPLLRLTQYAMWVQPIPSEFIDWSQSFIKVNPRVTTLNKTSFELIIIYSDPIDEYQDFPNRFLFRSGFELSGKRVSSFELKLNDTQKDYSLATNGINIALPPDAIVLGFSTDANENPPLYGKEAIDSDALKSTYITFKQGTQDMNWEFPCGGIDKYDQLIPNLDYFPIVPTERKAIDWQLSKISIKDNSNITDDMSFQFSIIWASLFDGFLLKNKD
jgi:hypothetical protein